MGHANPHVGVDFVAQFDHDLVRHPCIACEVLARAVGGVVHRLAIGPVLLGRAVGGAPVHEAEHAEGVQLADKLGVEAAGLALAAGHPQVDV